MYSSADADDLRVAELLGRRPTGRYEVVVRRRDGDPVVIRNHPLLDDGTPMPTRYWLVGANESAMVGRLESDGGVARAEAAVPPDEVAATHRRHAAERDAAMPGSHDGPRPSGGVGGTREGVKCLHAHLASWLARGDDPVGAWTAAQLGVVRDDYDVAPIPGVAAAQTPGNLAVATAARPVAAIDVGTNSTNLLVVAGDGTELLREFSTTRLGRGVASSGVLDGGAIDDTVACLARYRSLAASLGAGDPVVAATEACRRAANAAAFLDRAAVACGTRPEVLDPAREAALTWRGALGRLPSVDGPTLLVDVGGGSTEVAFGGADPVLTASLAHGAVTVTEAELQHDPPRPEELLNAIGHASDFAEDLARQHPELLGAGRAVGVAGTVATMAALDLGRFDPASIHGHVLSRGAVEDAFRAIATEAIDDRRHNPGLPSDRADIVVGGCCLLLGVMRKLRIEELTVSLGNVLDGLVMEQLRAR